MEEVGRQTDALQLFDEMAVVVSHKPHWRKLQGDLAEMLELSLKDEGELLSTVCLRERLNQVKRIQVEMDDVWTPLDSRTICIPQVARDLRHKIYHVWRDAASHLRSSSTTNDGNGMYANIFVLLDLSFYLLKDEEPMSSVLLCSLFREDIDIPVDYLVRYGTGLRELQDVHTLEEARDRVHTSIENLKPRCLLLDNDVEDCFWMHDVTSYFLLSVASEVYTYFWRMMQGYLDSPDENKCSSFYDISVILKNLEEFSIGINCRKLQFWKVEGYMGLMQFFGNLFDGWKVLKVVLMQHVLLKLVVNTVNPSHTSSLWLQGEQHEDNPEQHEDNLEQYVLLKLAIQAQSLKCLYKDKPLISRLDVKTNNNGDLVVTNSGQYVVREHTNDNKMSALPLGDLPMLQILRHYYSLEVASEYFRSSAHKISIGIDVYAAEEYLKTRVNSKKSTLKQSSGVYENLVPNADSHRQNLKSQCEAGFKSSKLQNLGPNNEKYVRYHSTVNGGREGPPLGTYELAKLLFNCTDCNGQGKGSDIDLIMLIPNVVSIPVIATHTNWTVFQTLGLRTSLIFKRVALIGKMLRSGQEPNLMEKRPKCMDRSPKSPIGLFTGGGACMMLPLLSWTNRISGSKSTTI